MFYFLNHTTKAAHAFEDMPDEIPEGFVEVTESEFTQGFPSDPPQLSMEERLAALETLLQH